MNTLLYLGMTCLFIFYFLRIKTLHITNEGHLNQPKKRQKHLLEHLPSRLTNEDV